MKLNEIRFVFLLINFSFLQVQAQTWNWAKALNAWSPAMETDQSNNVYLGGSYNVSTDLDPGPNVVHLPASTNASSGYLEKISPTGSLLWAKSVAQNSTVYRDVQIKSIKTDNAGNIYTIGIFSGYTDFDPSNASFYLAGQINGGGGYIFISKLDSSGNFLWAKKIECFYNPYDPLYVDCDSQGSVFVSGFFKDTVDFDPGINIHNLTSIAYESNFILKIDNGGNFCWAKMLGGSNDITVATIALDKQDNIYYGGSFTGSIDFDPDTGSYIINAAPIYRSGFIAKLDSGGHFKYGKPINLLNPGSSAYGVITSLGIDTMGNMIYIGHFTGLFDFNPGIGAFNYLCPGISVISKIDSTANLIWLKALPHLSTFHIDNMKIDNFNNILSSGTFNGTVDFNPDTLVNANLTSYFFGTPGNVMQDIFYLKLDQDGNFIWVKRIGGKSDEGPLTMAIDKSNSMISTGLYVSTSIGIGNDTLLNPNGQYYAQQISFSSRCYVAKLSDSPTSIIYDFKSSMMHSSLIFPNPTSDEFIVKSNSSDSMQISVCNLEGEILVSIKSTKTQETISTKNLVAGIYLVQIKTKDFIETRKLVVEK